MTSVGDFILLNQSQFVALLTSDAIIIRMNKINMLSYLGSQKPVSIAVPIVEFGSHIHGKTRVVLTYPLSGFPIITLGSHVHIDITIALDETLKKKS